MDPLFGLPAMKDTKAMDSARARNKYYERHLSKKVETLDSELKTKYCKFNNTVRDLHQFLVDVDPTSNKPVIYPPGLSDQQKKEYRNLRRGSVPSMSLKEFDQRMESKLQEKRAHRPKRYIPEVEKQTSGRIVDVKEYTFCAPIQKHRQTMRAAYDRATSNDIRFTGSRQEVVSKSSVGRHDGVDRRGSGSSGGSLPYPVGFNTEKRRNTVGVESDRRDNNMTLDARLVEKLRRRVVTSAISDTSDED